MVNPENKLNFDDIPRPKIGKMEQYIKLPILGVTAVALGISGLFIDSYEYSAKYYGARAITYDETYHYYPLMIMISCFAFLILRILLEAKILIMLSKFRKEAPKWRVIHLRWDMVITALAFVYLQLKVFSMLNIQYLK